jgi:hypothetical protein
MYLAPDDPDILEDAANTYELLLDRARAIEYAEKALQKRLCARENGERPGFGERRI